MRIFTILTLVWMICVPVNTALADNGKELRKAAAAGDITRIEALLAQGVDINSVDGKGVTALMTAAEAGQISTVQFLLVKGADKTQTDWQGDGAHDYALYATRGRYAIAHMIRDDLVNTAPPEHVALNGIVLDDRKWDILVRKAAIKRHWQIESLDPKQAKLKLDRKGRMFKVLVTRGDAGLTAAFVPGFGSQRANYLKNLAHDIRLELVGFR